MRMGRREACAPKCFRLRSNSRGRVGWECVSNVERTKAGVSSFLYWGYFLSSTSLTVAAFLPNAGDEVSSYSLETMSINDEVASSFCFLPPPARYVSSSMMAITFFFSLCSSA